MSIVYYKKISSCVNYASFSFCFPLGYRLNQHQKMAHFIHSLGENTNPPATQVLHILHNDFFIDFPAHGFPTFKVSFYPHVSVKQQKKYCCLLNHQLSLSLNT